MHEEIYLSPGIGPAQRSIQREGRDRKITRLDTMPKLAAEEGGMSLVFGDGCFKEHAVLTQGADPPPPSTIPLSSGRQV
jgi:hypothetical protein